MRAILNREIIVRLRTDDEGGTLVAATGTPTLVVTDGDGATVAGVSAASSDGTGIYKATIPAQTALDRLKVVWTATVAGNVRTVTEYVDVVSERLVPLWRLREDAELAGVTPEVITRLEDTVAEWFRSALKFPPVVESTRRSWLLEYPVQRLRIPGAVFPRSIISLAYGRGSGMTTWSPTDLAQIGVIQDGVEYLDAGTFAPVDFLRGLDRGTFVAGYYTVHATHGGVDFETAGPTEDLRRAAAVLARYVARTNNLPERARRIETAQSIIDLSMPSAEKPTGLPDVDAVITRYRIQAL